MCEIVLTVGHEYIWVALNVPLRKSFDHPIDLLCFPRKTNVHQKPTQSNVQRIPSEREFSDIKFESSYILGFRTENQLRVVKSEK